MKKGKNFHFSKKYVSIGTCNSFFERESTSAYCGIKINFGSWTLRKKSNFENTAFLGGRGGIKFYKISRWIVLSVYLVSWNVFWENLLDPYSTTRWSSGGFCDCSFHFERNTKVHNLTPQHYQVPSLLISQTTNTTSDTLYEPKKL